MSPYDEFVRRTYGFGVDQIVETLSAIESQFDARVHRSTEAFRSLKLAAHGASSLAEVHAHLTPKVLQELADVLAVSPADFLSVD